MFRKKHKFIPVETKSETYTPGLFQPSSVNVQQIVVIEQQDDDVADCLAGCFRCCIGIAKNAGK